MMKKITDYIRRRLLGAKTARRARHNAEVSARFRIAESDGKIYLLCLGTAIAVIGDDDTAQSITREVERARHAALEFESANNFE